MQSLEDFRAALLQGADEDTLDRLAEDVRRDGGAGALATALRLRIENEQANGTEDIGLTGLRFRLATTLEEVARTATTLEAGEAALEAARLQHEVLNDGEATARNLVLALRAGANDNALLARAITAAGDIDNAQHLVERALKRKEIKDDAALSASIRRAAQRLCERKGDVDGAFFEALKAARKQPEEGTYIDEVFRLAMEAKRDTEAAAFFGGLADDESFADRLRASLYNKLGATRERLGDKPAALAAFQASLFLRETKAARKNADRLAGELGASLGASLDAPLTAPPVPPAEVPPEMRDDNSAIRHDEPPDVTPSYPPNRTLRSMQPETALDSTHASVSAEPAALPDELPDALFPPVAPPGGTADEDEEIEATDLIVSAEPNTEARLQTLPSRAAAIPSSSAPADVTIPRYPANLDTASLADELPPPSLDDGLPERGPDVRAVRPGELPTLDVAALPASIPVPGPPTVSHGHFADEAPPSFLAPPEGALEGLPTRAPPSDEPTRRSITAGLVTVQPPMGSLGDQLADDNVDELADVPHTPAWPPVPPPAPIRPQMPPQAEQTMRDAPSPPIPQATVEELPPLPLPPPTVQSTEALDPVANALKVLADGDTAACIAAGLALDGYAPGDPRVLRLAARALQNEAALGELPHEAVELFARRADKHGDRAAQMALEIMRALPPDRISAYLPLWLAGARGAGLDSGRVLELLRSLAIEDAPDGPAFQHVEQVLSATNDLDERDSVLLAALLSARTDAARAALTRKRIALLEQRGRSGETLPLWAELATRLEPGDVDVRRAARRAHAERATPEERGRLLARIAKTLEGDEVLDVLHELLDVRTSVDDDVGAEAAAREILARRAGDPRATEVLITLLERDPRRLEELIETQRRAAAAVASVFGRTSEARTQLTRLAQTLERAGRIDDAAEAWAQIARLVPDDKNVDVAIEKLDGSKRHKEAVALLEEISSSVADDRWRARLLVRAADLTRTRLQKRGRARELLERALALDDANVGALSMLADIQVEMGDGAGAVSALERLAAASADAKARAQIEVRIARLLDELLLKPEAAILRYRAAVAADPSLRDAWEALRALARQRGDRPLLVEALTGLAGVEGAGKERAALWRQIAKVERDERGDPVAATAALRSALGEEPADLEALDGLVVLIAQRAAPELDLDAVLEAPPPALLDGVRAALKKAAELVPLPLPLWRLDAAARAHAGDQDGAIQRFEALLRETPDDLLSLLQLARIFAAQGEGADPKRLRILEQLLLHHAYSLKPPQQVEVWGDVAALRVATGDLVGAKKAARKVMAIASTEELKGSLSDRAVRAVALVLDDQRDTEREPRQVVAALRLDAARTSVDAERARLLERAADVAAREMADTVLGRQLLEEAVRADPRSASARDALLDLDVAGGDINGVLAQLKELTTRESDPKKRAALHLRRFRLMKKHGLEPASLSKELTQALESDAASQEILDAAAAWFQEKNDVDGLDRLYSAQLRALNRDDVRGRLQLLERLAQLRRYERRDLAGAVEALEAMTALDPEDMKTREDAARLYGELGLAKEAVNAWRGVLERDPIVPEAWRSIFSLYARARQGDEAFAVASTMAALELCDEDIARVTRTLRPPFPRWPIPPKDPAAARKKISHPLERTAIRSILDVTALRLLPGYARPLKEFGFKKRDALKESQIPTSVLLAVRTLAQLLGLQEIPPLYAGELGSAAGTSPPFAVLPAIEPGIVVTEEVLKGGITPERAFALGRAAAWLPPHALLAASLSPSQLRLVIESLVCAFLGPASLERPEIEVEKLAPQLLRQVTLGSDADAARMKAELLPALRDYEHARAHLSPADFQAGVGYTADRYGFLVSTDLGSAVKVIKSGAAGSPSIGARLAVKELVLFSASAVYLSLRRDLGLALPEAAAQPLLELD